MVYIGNVENERFEMEYIRFGSGKRAFVLLPGMSLYPISKFADSVADAYSDFSDDYTVWLFERKKKMSAGYSAEQMARDTAEAMISLGISDADILGVSQGGMIAQYIAAYYPTLVRRAVFGSSMAYANPFAVKSIGKWRDLAFSGDVPALLRSFYELLFSPETAKSALSSLSPSQMTATPEELSDFIVLSDAVINFDARSVLPLIKCPVFVIGSDNDRVLSPEGSRDLAALLHCPIYMYPSYGHGVYDEAPDYRERVLAFFNS